MKFPNNVVVWNGFVFVFHQENHGTFISSQFIITTTVLKHKHIINNTIHTH